MEIITRIQVFPIWWTNFDPKKNGGNKSFSCKTKASKPWTLMRRISLLWPSTKRMELIMWIQVLLQNKSIKTMYPNVKNMFNVPNYKKNRDYYRIQVCQIWWINFNSKENGGNKSFSCKTKASKSCILMERTCL